SRYSSDCGRASVISNHAAFEPTKMCSVGRMVGASTNDPMATCANAPSRTTEKRKDPQAPQRVSLRSSSPKTAIFIQTLRDGELFPLDTGERCFNARRCL